MTLNQAIKTCFEYALNSEIFPAKESVFSEYSKSLPSDFIYHYPTDIFWKVTSDCNLRCKHCYYHSNPNFYNSENEFSKDEALNLAKYFVEELNILSVILTGGEIFLSPYLFDLIEYFKSKNVCLTLLTNGTLINENTIKNLIPLLNKKYDNVQISFDGATSKTHDKIRGNGSFEKSLNALKLFSESGFHPSIATIITSENVQELADFTEFYKNYKIKELKFGKFKLFSDEQKYLILNTDDLFIGLSKLINNKIPFNKNFFNAYDFLKYEYGKQLLDTLKAPQNYHYNKLCHNHNRLFISANGNIYLCSSAETEGLTLGNIREKTFEEIWENRFNHPLFKERINFICTKCKYKYWCDSGCPVLAYKAKGNICNATSECNYQLELEKNNA